MTQPPRTPPRASDPPRLLPPSAPDAGESAKPERPLSRKQRLFVEEYLVDLNARQAALRAGYKGGSARTNSHFLVRHPKISTAIRAELDARAERTRVSADRVILELARIAFSDIGRILDWSGETFTVTPSAKLAPDDRAAIAELTVASAKDGGIAARVKLHDKQRALKTLARHLNLYGRFADPPNKESPAAAADRVRGLILERLEKLHAAQQAEEQELDDMLREAQEPMEEEEAEEN